MSSFLARASAALNRVDALIAPTNDDVQIIRPLLKKLISSARTPFIRTSEGYTIGTEKFPAMVGLNYIRLLVQKPNEAIYCRDLFSLGANEKPKEGTTDQNIEFRVMEELRTSYAGADVSSSYQEALDDKALRALKDKIATLEDAQSIEDLEELDFLRDFLDRNTFRDDSNQIKGEKDKIRQKVSKAIKYAIDKLAANENTRDIATHLDESIKPGADFQYFGEWKWKY